MNIPIDTQGLVTNSGHANHRVWVERDPEHDGAYYAFQTWDGPGGPGVLGVFDDWLETRSDVEEYFRDAEWTIEWRSDGPSASDRPQADGDRQS